MLKLSVAGYSVFLWSLGDYDGSSTDKVRVHLHLVLEFTISGFIDV